MVRDTFHYPGLIQALPNLSLDTSWDGVAADYLGIPFQGLTTFTAKISFPLSHPILPFRNGKPFPRVLSVHALSNIQSLPSPSLRCSGISILQALWWLGRFGTS